MGLGRQFTERHFGMLFGITLCSESGVTQTWATVLALWTITTITSIKSNCAFVTKTTLV
jgi:hypothetical protein